MKKRILTVLVAILTVIPLVLITPKADEDPLTPVTKDYVITSYGNYSVECSTVPSGASLTVGDSSTMGIQFSMPVISGGCSVSFLYNFESERSGTMRLNLTLPLAVTLKSCSFAVTGGRFTNMTSITTSGTSKIFDIKFQDTRAVSFTLFLPANNTNFDAILHPITLSNVSIQDGVGLFDIDATLDSIDSSLDLYLPGMSTNLSNIASNTSTMASDIAIIKGYLDGLEGYTDQIEPYLNTLIEYERIRDSIDIPIYSRFAYINLLRYGEISDQYNYPYNTAKYGFFPTILTNNYSAPAYNSDYDVFIPAGKTLHFIYTISYWANIFDFIDSNSVSVNPTINMIEGNNYYRSYDVSYTNTGSSNIFVNVAMNRNVNRPLIPLYLGVNVPADVAMLFNMDFDNTYTRLLQQIVNGVGGSSYDTSQYDQYEQTMDGLNDSLRDRFNNVDDNMQSNIDTLFTPSGTAGSDGSIFEKFNFNGVNSLFTGILNGIFISFPAFKYILLFALLLLVIGVMI